MPKKRTFDMLRRATPLAFLLAVQGLLSACASKGDLGWTDDGEYTETKTAHDIGTTEEWREHILDGDIRCLALDVADIDGDGHQDVVGATADDRGDLVWWQNETGGGETWVRRFVSNDFCQAVYLETQDMDGDDDPDIVASSFFTGNCRRPSGIAWFENRVAEEEPWVKHVIEGDAKRLFSNVFDIDGDNDPDVVGTYTSDEGALVWWENVSARGDAWKKHAIAEGFASASPNGADLDGDGDMDLPAMPTSAPADDLVWFENQVGIVTDWAIHPMVLEAFTPYSLFFSDMDGDGDPDAFSSDFQNRVAWWENTDQGRTWLPHEVHDGTLLYFPPTGGVDFDLDGDTDALGLAEDENDVMLFENLLGDGSEWTPRVIATEFKSTSSLMAADINGDGTPDIVGAANGLDLVVWWEPVL